MICLSISLTILIGMFLEIPTIWKKKPPQPKRNTNPGAPEQIPVLNPRRSSTTHRFSKPQSPSIWRPRRIGIFFSQHFKKNDTQPSTSKGKGKEVEMEEEEGWTCLVLVEPINLKEDEHLLFCYRKVHNENSPNRPPPNANTTSGFRRYTIEEDNLQMTIGYTIRELLPRYITKAEADATKSNRCATFITQLAKDIFWGWEEFATQVVQISAVSKRSFLSFVLT